MQFPDSRRLVQGLALLSSIAASTICVAQTAVNVDPYAGLPDRLKSLSILVDRQLQTVQSVNKIMKQKGLVGNQGGPTAAAKKGPSFSTIKGVKDSEFLESFFETKNLEPVLQEIQINALKNHQSQLQTFSLDLKKAIADTQSLPRAEALQRLDAIIVPPNIQQILQLAPDGKPLPSPPHLQLVPTAVAATLSPFVVGPGSAATVDYPSVAEIAYAWEGSGFSGLCTGTLISPSSVLTAAHCFCEFAKARTAAACATTYARGLEMVKTTDERFITVFFHDRGPLPVKEITIHPQYQYPQHDLAIITLKEDIADIMPAPLNTVRPMGVGEFATIVGFGMHNPLQPDGTPKPGPPVRASQGLKLWATINTGKCADQNQPGIICWNYQATLGDAILGSTCHGDSGGPAFAKIDGIFKLVGVTSGGADACDDSRQSFDVDIQSDVQWITATAGSNINPAFANAPNAFVSNPGSRAFSGPYHLFIASPDQWSSTFFVPSGFAAMRVSVNTTPTFSSLRLELFPPGANAPACALTRSDAFVVCAVPSPAAGSWKAVVTGSSPQESQIVATVAR